MKVVVLINNYNYSEYVGEAIHSLQLQTKKPDAIIVVDDGSTDDSVKIISEYCKKEASIEFINKENEGQLSCFNVVAPTLSDGDIAFFLDSDDIYPTDYIESVLAHVDSIHDFYFASTVRFTKTETPIASAKVSSDEPCSIPLTSSLTRRYGAWVGSPTSALAIKGRALKEILPYHDERNFKTRADDVLIFSSSILGHRKKFLPSLAIAYRVHGSNNFFGRNNTNELFRYFALEKLFNEMCDRAGLQRLPPATATYIEATSIPHKYAKKFFLPPVWRIFVHRVFEKFFKLIGLR